MVSALASRLMEQSGFKPSRSKAIQFIVWVVHCKYKEREKGSANSQSTSSEFQLPTLLLTAFNMYLFP